MCKNACCTCDNSDFRKRDEHTEIYCTIENTVISYESFFNYKCRKWKKIETEEKQNDGNDD